MRRRPPLRDRRHSLDALGRGPNVNGTIRICGCRCQMAFQQRQDFGIDFGVELAREQGGTPLQPPDIFRIEVARAQFDVSIGHPIDHPQIVVDDDAMIAAIHHDGLEKGFIGDEAVAVEFSEPTDAWIVTDKFAKAARHGLPLRSDEWRISGQKCAGPAGVVDLPIRLDEQIFDPVQSVGPFFALVQGANELLAGIGGEKPAYIHLRFEWKILTGNIDVICPLGAHSQQARHSAKLRIDKTVASPKRVLRREYFDPLIRLHEFRNIVRQRLAGTLVHVNDIIISREVNRLEQAFELLGITMNEEKIRDDWKAPLPDTDRDRISGALCR